MTCSISRPSRPSPTFKPKPFRTEIGNSMVTVSFSLLARHNYLGKQGIIPLPLLATGRTMRSDFSHPHLPIEASQTSYGVLHSIHDSSLDDHPRCHSTSMSPVINFKLSFHWSKILYSHEFTSVSHMLFISSPFTL